MRSIIYPSSARFLFNPYSPKVAVFKGQLHCHSNNSDGKQSPEATVTAYKLAGYDFVCLTDHNILTADPLVPGILFIPGIEETHDVHMGNIGAVSHSLNTTAQPIINDVVNLGALVSLNHPTWGVQLAKNDYLGLENLNFIEIRNATVESVIPDVWAAEKVVWASMLTSGKIVYALAADDCHDINKVSEFDKYQTMVFANKLGKNEILASLREGNFYCRQANGPIINSIVLEDNILTIATETECVLSFIGRDDTTFQTTTGTLFVYEIKGHEKYIRARLRETTTNERAWTQPVFIRSADQPFRRVGDDEGMVLSSTSKKIPENSTLSYRINGAKVYEAGIWYDLGSPVNIGPEYASAAWVVKIHAQYDDSPWHTMAGVSLIKGIYWKHSGAQIPSELKMEHHVSDDIHGSLRFKYGQESRTLQVSFSSQVVISENGYVDVTIKEI